MLLHCCRWLGRATHLLPYLCKRLILLSLSLMKSHKPLPSPSPLRPNYSSSSRHPWAVEHEHLGADRPSFIPGEMGCSWAAPGPSPLIRPFHKPHHRLLGLSTQTRGLRTQSSLFFFFFHRGFATLPSDEELADLDFFKDRACGSFSNKGDHYPLQY